MNRPAIDVSQVQRFTHLQTGCGCFPVVSTKPEQFPFWGQTFNSREIKFLLQHKTRLVKSNNKEVPFNLQGFVPAIKPQVLPTELTQRYVCLCKEVTADPHMWEAASTNVEMISD